MGGLFGWLLIVVFSGTILNYCLKFVNKCFGKSILASDISEIYNIELEIDKVVYELHCITKDEMNIIKQT